MEDIAEAADVSPRTFFNYFPSKEAALFGADPDRVAALRQRVVRQAPGEPVLEALRMVMVSEAQRVADELFELAATRRTGCAGSRRAAPTRTCARARWRRWPCWSEPSQKGLPSGCTDPDRDPYPGLLAATAAGVLRASITFWAGSGGTVPLDELIYLAFRGLADGLPERCA